MTDTVKLIIEVTAGVLPPEVQLKGGDNLIDALAGPPGGGLADGTELEPTGWTRHRPEPEHTRRFAVTEQEWHAAASCGHEAVHHDGRALLLAQRNRMALEYAAELMAQPHRFNHVRVDWIWL